jgi:RNA polymerase sigma-70 factor (ECF subfamily)
MTAERAADAVQESLVYAWRHWERMSAMENAAGYLYRMAKRRGWRHRRPTTSLPEIRVEDPEPPEPDLVAALRALSPMQRQVVYLAERLGLSQHEVADLLGVARTTVETHRERALTHLRHKLGVTIDD